MLNCEMSKTCHLFHVQSVESILSYGLSIVNVLFIRCRTAWLKGVIWMQDDNGTYSQCTRYDVDWTTTTENNSVVTTYLSNTSWSIVPCDHGWEYETSEMTSSIVIDVCRTSSCTWETIPFFLWTIYKLAIESFRE